MNLSTKTKQDDYEKECNNDDGHGDDETHFVFAQKKHGRDHDRALQAETMKKELALTDQQYANIKRNINAKVQNETHRVKKRLYREGGSEAR